MVWHKDFHRSKGGRWRCRVKERERYRKQRADPEYRERERKLERERMRKQRADPERRERIREYARKWHERNPGYRLRRYNHQANRKDQQVIDRLLGENPWLKEYISDGP